MDLFLKRLLWPQEGGGGKCRNRRQRGQAGPEANGSRDKGMGVRKGRGLQRVIRGGGESGS